MKKLFLILIVFFSAIFFLVKNTHAVCPVCTIAVGAGIGLSRYLGIDDTITGLWIGGLTVSFIIWTLTFFDKKKIHFPGKKLITLLGYYLLIIIPLYLTGIAGHPLNTLWGIDKLLLGTAIGSIAFFSGSLCYDYLKRKNNNRAYFPFQKVVMPIIPLIILSIIFYFLIK